jgi:DHA1 family bicyclomycin/chloramphenicol resistance-like MFS transporter
MSMTSPQNLAPADPRRKELGEREFVMMMALAPALQALAIDAMLPALSVMATDLGSTSANERQLIVAVFLFGIGAGALFPGALSDRFGRRPVLLASLGAYVLCSLGCALITDMTWMLVLRALQAVLSGALNVLPSAIIRDRVGGDRMARMQSLIFMVFMIVPMLAPLLGQGIMMQLGWRWIFGMMAVLALAVMGWVWWRLPETLHPEFRQAISIRRIAGNMAEVVSTRGSIGYVGAGTLVLAGSWGYINSSQQLLAEHFGLGSAFPYVFGAMALSIALANFVNSRIVERFGARRVSHASLLLYIVAASVQVWFAHAEDQTIWQFAPLMAFNLGLIGFIGANFQSISMQPFARIAGSAASIQTFLRTLIAATLGALIGQSFDGTARPLANALLIAGIGALLLILFSERGRLFRRLYPPGTPRPTDVVM